MAGANIGDLISGQMMAAAKVVEEQLDAEIEKLEKMDEDDLELLRVRSQSSPTSVAKVTNFLNDFRCGEWRP